MRRLLPSLSAPVVSLGASLALAGPLLAVPPAAGTVDRPVERRADVRQVAYQQWDAGRDLRGGRLAGTRVTKGALTTKPEPSARRTLGGTRYDGGHWYSPWTAPGFDLTELIPSWSATTRGNSWIEVSVRGRAPGGKRSSWDVVARWTSGDRFTKRTSVPGQGDDLADVSVDTVRTAGLASYQLRVTLLEKVGTRAKAAVDTIGAVASRLPSGSVTTSAPGVARGVVLDVPQYSQMIHQGHSPQWGGGGQAWCSPTSTSMVLAYYDALPPAKTWSWVGAGHPDPQVDHAARMTYDAQYQGTGNWPFNTAYAAPLADHAFVTRLRSLRDAERLVKAGIPVVVSVSFGSGELSGAPISASNGHLLVVVGFTESGDVVVNDPAASSNAGVRRTYDRGELENAWLPTSGGLAYVIHDDEHPLPRRGQGQW
ncbi:peptidase C39 family protein [Nocardioides sp. SYSU DS0663]|uniref:peptidase C39 family protein n=1 Tax=Nocardioides sp. SYSU DS0663 TaxID=3416445 RepID=UPI003F4B627E